MINRNKISIICATIDSTEEICEFLNNILIQFDLVKTPLSVEVIVVDQNNENGALPIQYLSADFLKYIKSEVRGLSLNRNIGLKYASGEWLMFLDTDCRLPNLFFDNIYEILSRNLSYSVIVGKITLIESSLDVIRQWPKKDFIMNGLALWRYATSVNCIYRSEAAADGFDELFGIGAEFGSCEDVDFALRSRGPARFVTEFVVHHPLQKFSDHSMDKIFSYGKGFGAVCRKHIIPLGIFVLLYSIVFKIFSLVLFKITIKQLTSTLRGRIIGFWKYNEKTP